MDKKGDRMTVIVLKQFKPDRRFVVFILHQYFNMVQVLNKDDYMDKVREIAICYFWLRLDVVMLFFNRFALNLAVVF